MFRDIAKINKVYDFYVFQQGPHTIVNVLSTEALAEFERLVPTKIDRYNQYGQFPVGNIVRGSLGQSATSKEFLVRRKEAAKAIGINHVSQYIPLMLDVADEWIKTVKKDERIDLTIEITKIVFKIITKILFGTDVDKIKSIPYLSPKTGKYVNLTLEEFLSTYPHDEFYGFLSVKWMIFPFLVKYGFFEPYRTNIINKNRIIDELVNFTSQSNDANSIFKQLEGLRKFSKEDLINDTLFLLYAGFDTISHSITSCLFQLKKNPHVLENLKHSFENSRITEIDTSKLQSLKDIFENCDYLNYVVKETLRIDGPTMQGMMYYTKEDIKICGISFKKGTKIYPNNIYTHYNQSEWFEPTKFIPERFNPESEYFFKPNTDNLTRHPKSYIPFGFGARNCMGQALGMLETKVLLSRILTSVDYEIDQELLDNEDISFNMFTQFKLYGKINEKQQ